MAFAVTDCDTSINGTSYDGDVKLEELKHASALAQGNVLWAVEAFSGKGRFSRVRRLKTP
jgi:hypothetical protein